MRVFLALPDRPLAPEVERALRETMAELGHEILPPPPLAHGGLAASERARFLASVDRMMEADLLLADASESDASVGWCVAWFLARGRLVVLTCRKDARAQLAPMLAGNPSPWQRLVLYADERELRALLRTSLAA
ncbi:MAG TPA: hypothetical protein VFH78_00650 [Candidatus Thermoplasmatota archaeon]|nr:hypothetical protein [Candidatus Thermoplasmatota archaeon]